MCSVQVASMLFTGRRVMSSDSSVSDYCRLCKISLAKICKEVGLPLVQDSRQYSDRVCNPSGRKIRNLGQLYQLSRAAITSTEGTPVKSSNRTLDMPDKASPAWRKSKTVRVNSPAAKSPSVESSTSAKGKSRKSLFHTNSLAVHCIEKGR